MVLRKIDIHNQFECKRMTSNYNLLSTPPKINLKWIKDLNVRPVTMKLVEGNKEKPLVISVCSDFFGNDTKSTNNKSKNK